MAKNAVFKWARQTAHFDFPHFSKEVDCFKECEALFETIYAAVSKMWYNFDELRKKLQELSSMRDSLEKEVLSFQEKSTQLQKQIKNQQKVISPKRKSESCINWKLDLQNIHLGAKLAPTGGSSASVYTCYVDGWECVMKELDTSTSTQDQMEYFEQEISLVEKLPSHPNICRYLFHTASPTSIRQFMTKYDMSLREHLNSKVPNFPLDGVQTKNFALDLARGLAFLHSHNIIHRDLKSENIFVRLNQLKKVVSLVIGDFDTAKQITKQRPTTCIGTPQYMAPEVFNSANEKCYNMSSDIYSYGMLLYEILTGKMPYQGMSPKTINEKVAMGERPQLPSNIVLNKALQAVVAVYHQATNLVPENRPSATQIVRDLESNRAEINTKLPTTNSSPSLFQTTMDALLVEERDTLISSDCGTTPPPGSRRGRNLKKDIEPGTCKKAATLKEKVARAYNGCNHELQRNHELQAVVAPRPASPKLPTASPVSPRSPRESPPDIWQTRHNPSISSSFLLPCERSPTPPTCSADLTPRSRSASPFSVPHLARQRLLPNT